MGRNAAFGRPSAIGRVQRWWGATSRTARQNLLLALGVAALFVAIVLAAVARDSSSPTSRVISARPQPTSTVLFTPSTVFVGNLADAAAAGATSAGTASAGTPSDPPGPSTTTVSTAPAARPAPAAPTPVPATTQARAPAPATTQAPAPITTVVNPNVIFTEVPVDTTTTRPPATTTTVPTTLAPATTLPASTSTTAPSLPVSVPDLLGP